jgi:hypothetical protein
LAETTEHVDKTFVVANSLILEIFVARVTLFFEHQLILVIEQKDIRAID